MTIDPRPVFRFAPSPNGRLHLGHAYSALLNQEMARRAGGVVLLRIEDTDLVRCRPELERHLLADLEWLGFQWHGVPQRQSDNLDRYRDVIADIEAEGLAYPAFSSRAQVRRHVLAFEEEHGSPWPRDPDGSPLFPPADRSLPQRERERLVALGEPHAIRLDTGAAAERVGSGLTWEETGAGPDGETGTIIAEPLAWGDVLLAGRDIPASYNLASVVDDALQGVTHVVRGRDLFWSTSVHRLLQELMGYRPPVYHHHDLILDTDGTKLSKSRNDTSLAQLRAAGASPGDVARMVGLEPA